ncbi:unnamed protein product [Hyaloperonospora brassicae]|nr:unnamed protein product [Hyaloperonospora brassicae]
MDVYYSPNLARNIINYDKLDQKGYSLKYSNGKRSVARRSDGQVAFDVTMENSVLIVETVIKSVRQKETANVIMAAIHEKAADEMTSATHRGSLLYFHQRLGHLSYDAIEKIARNPSSGIELTDHKRMTCITCAQSKQTKNKQNQKDSGQNAPIDCIGGVICSDLKGPLTPADRLGNRYLIDFIDYKTNYCRVFLAQTKDAAAKKFEHFLVLFERRFECRIAVLRTDGGGEYQNVDLFCKSTGVARQVSEARNQASNGKA